MPLVGQLQAAAGSSGCCCSFAPGCLFGAGLLATRAVFVVAALGLGDAIGGAWVAAEKGT